MVKKIKFEKVPLAVIYKEGNKVYIDLGKNTTEAEIYGFCMGYCGMMQARIRGE